MPLYWVSLCSMYLCWVSWCRSERRSSNKRIFCLTISIMPLSISDIQTLSLSISDIQKKPFPHKHWKSLYWVSHFLIVMLNLLSIHMESVTMLGVVMLSAWCHFDLIGHPCQTRHCLNSIAMVYYSFHWSYNGIARFLHFHWLKRAPKKRCCNL